MIKNYIEQAYSQVDGHTVSVVTPFEHPNPPVESAFKSFSDAPCSQFGQDETSYDGLYAWWKDYHACHSLYDAKDCNLLATEKNAPGGRGGGDFCVAHSKQLSNLTTSTTGRSCSDGHEAMGTVLHEAGHCVGLQHEDRYGYEDPYEPSKYFMTPVLKGYAEKFDEGNNDCGDYIENYDDSTH